jgi:hypothetical protein
VWKKKGMLECRAEFWGGKQHATNTIEVQVGGCGYGPGGFKNWWEGMACGISRNKRSGGHQRRETQTLTKKKKRTKKDKRCDTEKKKKESQFGPHGAPPHSLPKRPSGLPFGPQVRPESGFSYQL